MTRALLAVLVLALAASFAAGADAQMKVALICSGSTTDGGWNQLAKDGIDAVAKELGAKVSVVQKVSADKAGDEMRAYATDGYDLVIAHGYEFLNPAAEVAKGGAKTKLAVSGADVAKDGIVTIDFDLSQASYQVGIVAARLSKSGKLGFIGGAPIPSVKACYRGFLAGAKSVRPDVTVAETYTSWDQPEQSKSQAEALMQQGVDAIFHDVDAASRGIFEAVKAANLEQDKPRNLWVFGSCADQNANTLCTDHTPASAVIRLDKTFLAVAKAVKDGSFKPGVITENLARGTCVTVLNPKLVESGVISKEVQAEVEAAGKKLAAGEIVVPAQ
jgi:basic membrane lipoprotein Med (substrate-binding protein (PBP1-ABC) superfamily)